jgi:mono/diheme cytochrome c family protein
MPDLVLYCTIHYIHIHGTGYTGKLGYILPDTGSAASSCRSIGENTNSKKTNSKKDATMRRIALCLTAMAIVLGTGACSSAPAGDLATPTLIPTLMATTPFPVPERIVVPTRGPSRLAEPEPTDAPTHTPEPSATSLPTPEPTSTPEPTDTPESAATVTSEPTRTATPDVEAEATPTVTAEPEPTATPEPVETPTTAPTPVPTVRPSPTPEPQGAAPQSLADLTEEEIYADLPAEIAAAMEEADPDRGQQIAQLQGCYACHSLEKDARVVGPSWYALGDHAVTRVEGESPAHYLYNSIVHPNQFINEGYPANVMPQIYADTLSLQQIADLIAYSLTLVDEE